MCLYTFITLLGNKDHMTKHLLNDHNKLFAILKIVFANLFLAIAEPFPKIFRRDVLWEEICQDCP